MNVGDQVKCIGNHFTEMENHKYMIIGHVYTISFITGLQCYIGLKEVDMVDPTGVIFHTNDFKLVSLPPLLTADKTSAPKKDPVVDDYDRAMRGI